MWYCPSTMRKCLDSREQVELLCHCPTGTQISLEHQAASACTPQLQWPWWWWCLSPARAIPRQGVGGGCRGGHLRGEPPLEAALLPVKRSSESVTPKDTVTINLLAIDKLVDQFARAHHSAWGWIFTDSCCILYCWLHLLEHEMFGHGIDQGYPLPITSQTKSKYPWTWEDNPWKDNSWISFHILGLDDIFSNPGIWKGIPRISRLILKSSQELL